MMRRPFLGPWQQFTCDRGTDQYDLCKTWSYLSGIICPIMLFAKQNQIESSLFKVANTFSGNSSGLCLI